MGVKAFKTAVREWIAAGLRRYDYDMVKRRTRTTGDAFVDMAYFVTADEPVLFDVGGNIGQTVEKFRAQFPCGRIFSFEPGPTAFAQLQRAWGRSPGVSLWPCAVGAAAGKATFPEHIATDMSSFLPMGPECSGQIAQTVNVDVVRLDDFVREQGIDHVDILKIDTQGFELEVFKGAGDLLQAGKVGMIYFELTLMELYRGLPRIDVLFQYLLDRNYRLVLIDNMHYQDGILSWMDALFVHANVHATWLAQRAT